MAMSSRRGNKNTDPNAPKRPIPAYTAFANEKLDSVRKENPASSNGQAGQIVLGLWKALSDEERVSYKKKADEDKKRYEREMAAYKASKTDENKENEE